MKPSEEEAMDGMIAAARKRPKSGQLKLAKWREDVLLNGYESAIPVWLCGWRRDPDTRGEGETLVGWRLTEEEINELCAECAAYLDRAIRPPRVILHGPCGTERLRG